MDFTNLNYSVNHQKFTVPFTQEKENDLALRLVKSVSFLNFHSEEPSPKDLHSGPDSHLKGSFYLNGGQVVTIPTE